LIWIHEKSQGYSLEAEIARVPKDYGNHCRQSIVNALFAIPISGPRMKKYFLKKDIVRLEKTAVE